MSRQSRLKHKAANKYKPRKAKIFYRTWKVRLLWGHAPYKSGRASLPEI